MSVFRRFFFYLYYIMRNVTAKFPRKLRIPSKTIRASLRQCNDRASSCSFFRHILSFRFIYHIARYTAMMLDIVCIPNQFKGDATPYTFIAPDPRALRFGLALRYSRNILPPWDHRRNYPLMPIHKSVGHFQSLARNSGRNTAHGITPRAHRCSFDQHTDRWAHLRELVPSLGTNIRVSFSTIRGQQEETS